MPDVLLAVAVEVEGVLVELRRQELGEPHRAAPRGAHVGELQVPLVEHLERVEQFLREHLLAAAVVALRRQHRDGVLGQLVGAERGLAAPDRQQHVAGHAELLLDRRQRAFVLDGELLGLRGQPRDVRVLDVVGRRLHELGLAGRRPAGAARNIEVRQRQIGLHAADRRIESLARNAHGLRLRPQRFEPALKRRFRGQSRRA